ncbi:hypothetical protein DACRYDRAFT_23556 [Dacryopinax primogenitus]|uniref:Uncharacterized protein n=1 Tax=Dacryopinax primogenitus (strain DJM 731) TaxID=1858805 RepID=M5FUT6_DACPD|nr:uncharacterized protein DACRYDRAFT_23556 [Dacryopinax primogenitus]EJU00019.1 hypothetical protein DACRYDRAFT_23556 [Dacryopinax primogenitus]
MGYGRTADISVHNDRSLHPDRTGPNNPVRFLGAVKRPNHGPALFKPVVDKPLQEGVCRRLPLGFGDSFSTVVVSASRSSQISNATRTDWKALLTAHP